MTRAGALARLASVGIALAAAPSGAACLGPILADLPLLEAGGLSAVPVLIDGAASALIVDTGATHTALSAEAVARLGLGEQRLDHAVVSGIGGLGARSVTDVRELDVGGLRFREFNVPVVALSLPPAGGPPPGGLPLGGLPLGGPPSGGLPSGGLPVAGVLGASVLSRFDVELDFPARRLRLRAPSGCAPGAPDRRPAIRLPLTSEPSNLDGLLHHDDVLTVGNLTSAYDGLPYPDHARLFTVVWVNLRPMLAVVDTGASVSALTPEAALRAGLPEGGARLVLSGVGEGRAEGRLVRAARVRIGGDERADVPVGVAGMDLGRADMILGRDLMQGRRVLLAYAAREMVWQAPAGGGEERGR